MSISAVKIEVHIQGCQQLVPDILSQFVIWANHIHVLENKLVLDVKEVQRIKKLCKIQALGKICFCYAKVVIMRVLLMPKNYCSATFIKMNNSKSPKLSNASSSKQMGNQAISFPPFYKTAENQDKHVQIQALEISFEPSRIWAR
jgi:hypothetical protein